jgi:lipopolysaccharide biosynthesis glycosyltransferase
MIEIITACDDNYIQHLSVMLCSLLKNTQDKKNIRINVIDGGISQSNKDKLLNFINDVYHLQVNYLLVDKSIYQQFPISHHFTHTIYYRISMPLLFDISIKKVLYLDADMVIKDDIKKLWDVDISNYYASGVEALSFVDRFADLNMPQNSLYFCSGLLLINLTKWREDNIMTKVIDFIEKNQDKIQMWDQDSLNSVLCGKWLPLPLKWNQQTYFFDDKIYKKFSSRQDFIEARNNPSIIHYTSSHKPWHYISNHPYKEDYFQYLKLTPWKSFKPKFNLWLYIEKIVRIYTPKTLLNYIKFLLSIIKSTRR